MNLSTVIIDGVMKLTQKLVYKNRGFKTQENVLRIFNPREPIPERVLYESKIMPGIYLDEANDQTYTECNGKLTLIN